MGVKNKVEFFSVVRKALESLPDAQIVILIGNAEQFKTSAVFKCVIIVKPTLPVVSGVRVGLALEQMRNRIAAKIAGDAVNVCGCIPLGKQAVELQCALAVEGVSQIKAQFIVPAISGDFLNDGIVRGKITQNAALIVQAVAVSRLAAQSHCVIECAPLAVDRESAARLYCIVL